jgi:putative ABC transport system permease protein
MRDWKADLRPRLASLRLSPAREASIVEELSQHLEDRRTALIASGADDATATAQTLAELARADLLAARLGTLAQARWTAPPVPGVPARGAMRGVWQDLRYAGRTLRRDPLFTAIAVVTLTLGIGLNTAMFGFMNALLFRPLPFADAQQLVRVFRTTAEQSTGGLTAAEYRALSRAEAGFGRFAAYRPAARTLAPPAQTAEWLDVSPGLFDVLGVQPVLGRAFRPGDENAGQNRVVLLSARLWQDQFGGDAAVVGRTLQGVDGPYEIVGVLPPAATDHRLFGRIGLFSPLSLDATAPLERTTRTLTVLGRRGPAVTPAQAEAFVAATAGDAAAGDPAAPGTAVTWRIEALPDSDTSPTGRALLAMLLGLSGCVLLVACANLANLLLARAIDRSREFALRAALGASTVQLVRTLLLECALVAVAGGAGAVAVALWTTRWLQSVIVDGGGPAIPLDWRVLGFAAATSLATVLLCGVVPALFTRRIAPNDALKSGGRGATAGRGHVRIRHAFLVGQFALALLLVAGASFFLRGTAHMLTLHHGWNADGVAQAELSLPVERYRRDEDVVAFQQRAADRLAGIAGVTAASVSYGLPYKGLRGISHYVADAAADSAPITARINGISPDYFTVTGTRLSAGRAFTPGDTAAAPKVAIISESLARRWFPDGRVLGRRVAGAGDGPRVWLEIVGVAADVRSIDVAQEPAPYQLYQPTAQDPRRDLIVAVRSTGATSAATLAAMRAAIVELDAGLVPRRLRTATASMEDVTTSMSVITTLLVAFAALGLLLAALGIYGAMTRMVAQRTDEIGLRIALGAQARDVLRLVLRSASGVVGLGMVLGLGGALGLSRLLGAVLPSMTTDTGTVTTAAVAVLTAVAVVACCLPARRAVRVDPMTALRGD